ncbi:hypothetical protein PCANC_14876 [Puccinia coronata f. sp. avenae]|uniref:SWIM-type domain-containing protein n=1 Tax=Puccinia coronata f. sp. avenae TaxID=200324 RepID=A0A2N5UNR1_9BASI|nr:hypothetical protein PCANC_14876 [Puccinia coronata f. sp. avenae]
MYTQDNPKPLLDNFFLLWGKSDHQGIHTNNYTESWHRVLKTSYLPPTERLQIDEVVQILTDDVESHYRWAQIQVATGFAWQTTNKFQQCQKSLAELYSPTDMEMLGIACVKENEGFLIDSFTNPTVKRYRIKYQPATTNQKGWITRCSCPYFSEYSSACKHMYYLASTLMLPVVEAVSTLSGTRDTFGQITNGGKGPSLAQTVDLTNSSTDEYSSEALDSDIEVIQGSAGKITTYKPPQREKRAHYLSDPSTQDPKRICQELANRPQGNVKQPKRPANAPAGPNCVARVLNPSPDEGSTGLHPARGKGKHCEEPRHAPLGPGSAAPTTPSPPHSDSDASPAEAD